MTKKLLMGNEAMAHAALEAGVGVAAGYPGTPSSEIIATIAHQHSRGAAHGVHVEWSTNEKAALEMLFGASLSGLRCLFTCKQMGLNVASDALMSLNYVSVRGGLVLIVADDPGPISSQTEQDTRRFAMFAKVPVLDPATPEQAYDMVKAAFDLSERFHTPVIVRPTTRVDHASAFFDVQEETHALAALEEGFVRDHSKYVIFPGRAYQAHAEIIERLDEMSEVFSTEQPYTSFNSIVQTGSSVAAQPTFGILVGGISASYAREALRNITDRAAKAGIAMPSYRLMQVGTPYPFPERAIGAFISGLSSVLVLEELDGVLEDQLARFAGFNHTSFDIVGRTSRDVSDHGENTVDDIMLRIERFLGLTGRMSLYRFKGAQGPDDGIARLSARGKAELPNRPPVLCAGCPHRGSFYATKQAVEIEGEEAVFCGDIGCYTLGNAKPLDALDTCLCMGAGITMAQGIAVADPTKKAIAYIGDSTFFASGAPGLSNAAYNGHDITVMVLDNSTTAMTGFQPHPGNGITLMGGKNPALSIEAVLRANGFEVVEHANPFDRDASVAAARKAISHKGPSAVIFEGACAQLTKPKKAVVINQELCTGCRRCITSIGCPAISFNQAIVGPRSRDRGQATIDTELCNGCGLCTQVCPFHAIHIDSAVYRASAAHLASAAGGWPELDPFQQEKVNQLKQRRAEQGMSVEEAVAEAAKLAEEAAVEAAEAAAVALAEQQALEAEVAAERAAAEGTESAAEEPVADMIEAEVVESAAEESAAEATEGEAAELVEAIEGEEQAQSGSEPDVPALAGEDELVGAEEVVEEEAEQIEEQQEEEPAVVDVSDATSEAVDEVLDEPVDETADEGADEGASAADENTDVADEDSVPDLEYIPAPEPIRPLHSRPVPMPDPVVEPVAAVSAEPVVVQVEELMAESVSSASPASEEEPVVKGAHSKAASEPPTQQVEASIQESAPVSSEPDGEALLDYKAAAPRKKMPTQKPSRGKHAAPETLMMDFGFDDEEEDEPEADMARSGLNAVNDGVVMGEPDSATVVEADAADYYADNFEVAYETDEDEVDEGFDSYDDVASSAPAPDDAPYSASYDDDQAPWDYPGAYDAWGAYDAPDADYPADDKEDDNRA